MGKSDHLGCAGKDNAAILLPHAVRLRSTEVPTCPVQVAGMHRFRFRWASGRNMRPHAISRARIG
jgi:hypothetical protein